MRKLSMIGLVTLFAVGFQGVVEASSVTVNFVGKVTSVDSALAPTFAVDQILSGSFVYDSSTLPRAGSPNPGVQETFDALQSLSFTLGGYAASSSGTPEIQIDDGPDACCTSDRFGVVSRASDGLSGALVNGFSLDAFLFRLDDSTYGVYSTAASLPSSVNLSSFDSSAFFLFFDPPTAGPYVVSGTLTAVSTVPEPTSLFLFGTGLLGLFGYGWRQQRRVV